MEQVISNELQSHWLGKVLGKALASRDTLMERVEHGLEAKHGDRDKNADWLISRKTTLNTTCGAISGAVGFIPVLGTIGALIATGMTEFAIVLKMEIELCVEMAHNYGHDIKDPQRMYELLAIIGRKRDVKSVKGAKSVATSKTLNSAINRYARIGIIKALTRTAEIIELRMGLRAAVKTVPVIGVVLGGTINYVMTQNTGKLAKEFYQAKVVGS